MHPVKNSYFILGSLSYLLLQFCRQQHLFIPKLINSYATDLLFMPLLFMATLWLTRIVKRTPNLVFSIPMLIVVFVYVSVVFEYYLPQKSSIYVQDSIDVLMYLLGTILFYFLQKKTVIAE